MLKPLCGIWIQIYLTLLYVCLFVSLEIFFNVINFHGPYGTNICSIEKYTKRSSDTLLHLVYFSAEQMLELVLFRFFGIYLVASDGSAMQCFACHIIMY